MHKLVAAIALLAALGLSIGRPLPAGAETTAIDGGGSHTCAITDGALQCWGANDYGQLGLGTTSGHSTPQDVDGLSSGVAAVAAGSNHTCAITGGGAAQCWGRNNHGQLGDGTTANHGAPQAVDGLGSGVAAIAAGDDHTCAITDAGGLQCWGANGAGQLGDGTTADRPTPVDVVGLSSGVVAVAAGGSHTCALTSTGGVKCWGDNANGQLGNGTTVDAPVPVDVVGLSIGATAVAAGGSHSCAITDLPSAGGLKCWGYNNLGQVGDGTTTNRTTPADVSGLSSGVAAVSAGFVYTCAIAEGGGVQCWGGNGGGQLGDDTTTTRHTPVEVVELSSPVSTLTTGAGHTCVIAEAGVLCWGGDTYGQLGDGRMRVNPTAVDVVGLDDAVGVAAGEYHTCGLTGAGGVRCWGRNFNGQLGDGTTTDHNAPQDVAGLTSGVVAIAAGSYHSCAVTSAGEVRCWGANQYGQVGNGTWTDQDAPAAAGVTGTAVAITAGNYHTCAVSNAGGLQCWGNNPSGALGDGTTTSQNTPQNVVGLGGSVTAAAAGGLHTCALTGSGGIQCWGRNEWGQLGDGSTVDHGAPADVSSLTSGAAAITAGYFHSCALTSGSGLRCWGRNLSGQIGDATNANRSAPVDVFGLASGATAVTSGGVSTSTCAITTTGGARCWGFNTSGQVGDGTTTSRNAPVDVIGLTSGVTAIATGHYHACAVKSAGGVECWGDNLYGELGNGWDPSQETPVAVVPEPALLHSLALGVALVAALARRRANHFAQR